MEITILVNRESGKNNSEEALEETIRSAFAKQELQPKIMMLDGSELKSTAAAIAKQKPDAVVAAGGDGSVSTVASALIDTGIPFGVLPMGTLNNFARDLNIPLQTEGAAEVISRQHTTQVDVGQVNDRYFLNNSSIGVYPWAVKEREASRPQTLTGKWLAMARAWGACLYRFPLSRVQITLNEKQRVFLKTPFIFIGNNQYKVDLSGFGNRKSLRTGKLCLYTSRHQGRAGIPRLAWSVIWGKLREKKNFEMHMVSSLEIESQTRRLSVALDGEVEQMEVPLNYSIHPSALNVFVPENKEDEG